MAKSEVDAGHRLGPRRPPGSPSGPDEVRRAVLDAAAQLFAERGVAQVSLRDVATAANTHLGLIGRYIGDREELELAVFDDLSAQLARSVSENPLSGQGHGVETVMGKWSRVAASLVIRGRPLAGREGFNPVAAMANTIVDGYGLDPVAARVERRKSWQWPSDGESSRTTWSRRVSWTRCRWRRFARSWCTRRAGSVRHRGRRRPTPPPARSEHREAIGTIGPSQFGASGA